VPIAIVAALASALGLWVASPSVGLGWLAWVALVPAAVVTLRSPGSRAARLAMPLAYGVYLELLLVPALPFGLTDGQWVDAPLAIGGSPVLAVALLAIPAFTVLLYALGFGRPWGVERLPPTLAPVAAVVVPALAWTALEVLRVKLDPGGFWGPVFLSQADEPTAGLAALAGPWAITFAVVATNYSIALALTSRRALPALAAGAVALAATLAGAALTAGAGSDTAIRVAAIQPGYDTAEENRWVLRNWEATGWDEASLDVARDLGELTRAATAEGAELVVWPEATMYVDPRTEPETLGYLRRLARSTGAAILVPFFLPEPEVSQALAVTPEGRLTGVRSKQRAMWYLGEGQGSTPSAEPLVVGGVPLGVMLGVDTEDPAVPRLRAARGATLLVSSTHDWHALATQQRALASLGAAGAGVALVRSDWRYGSAIHDPAGEVIADAGPDLARATVVADVALAGATTPYVRIGDVFGWTAVALAAIALALSARGVRRGARGAPAASAGSTGGTPQRARTAAPARSR
jgi:apolipoprotein N-acyltransferase